MTDLLVPAAVSYDQVSASALRTRTAVVEFEAALGGLTSQRHDAWTVADASESLDALDEALRWAEEAQRAAATAADLAEQVPPPSGKDPELERMEFIVSFHESGHAIYAAQSRIMTPASAEIDVDRTPLIQTLNYCGLVMVQFTKDPRKWKERDFIDDAACSLAGSAAECYWMQRIEGADYRQSLEAAYATHSASDYEAACDNVGEGTAEFRKAERWARRVVIEQWGHIAGMAETLREQERMSAGQISRAA